MTVPYLPARAKLWIGSLDDPRKEVRAQYNPKELQLEKQVPWGDPKSKNNQSGPRRQDSSVQHDLEFNGAPKRSMSIELLFDTAELPGESVEKDIQMLEELSSVRNPEEKKPEERRPHHCIVVWGASGSGMPPFQCVIESLATKYTMWDHAGTPKRATCTVKLREAHRLTQSVGLQNTSYGEKRRGPGWDREKPHEQDRLTVTKYNEAMEEAEKAHKERVEKEQAARVRREQQEEAERAEKARIERMKQANADRGR